VRWFAELMWYVGAADAVRCVPDLWYIVTLLVQAKLFGVPEKWYNTPLLAAG
jgi:hypothetical protein